MKRALIYCRVSTDEQAERGYSLDTQEKYCRQFAKRNNFQVVSVFRDEGKSGRNLDRPALTGLLEKVQTDKTISSVIIQETDRLSRNTKDHLTIKAMLQKSDVELISVAQPMLDDSPEGTMIDTIIASVNQFQSDLNGRKTSKGMQEKFDSGWWPSQAPLGYINKEVNTNKKIIAPDSAKWYLVKRALKLYLTGNYSVSEITDLLYEKGLTSQAGKKVCVSVMTKILRNPFYAGKMTWKNKEKIGKHKAMITIADHKRILEILDLKNHHALRRRRYRFLLKGFLFCNVCGSRYTAEAKPKKNTAYYHCRLDGKVGKARPHTNVGQNVRIDELERQVEERFKEIQFSQKFINLVLAKIKKINKKQKGEIDSSKRELLNQKHALEQKRDVAEEKLLSQTITDSAFQRINDKIRDKLDIVQENIDELDAIHTIDFNTIRSVLNLTRNVYKYYKEADPELKRRLLSLFWDKFYVQDKKIVYSKPNKLLEALIRDKHVRQSSDWQPSPELHRTLMDWRYWLTIKERVKHLKRSAKILNTHKSKLVFVSIK